MKRDKAIACAHRMARMGLGVVYVYKMDNQMFEVSRDWKPGRVCVASVCA